MQSDSNLFGYWSANDEAFILACGILQNRIVFHKDSVGGCVSTSYSSATLPYVCILAIFPQQATFHTIR